MESSHFSRTGFSRTQDSNNGSSLRHTQNFHSRPQWPDPVSTYTVFHGEEKPLPTYTPKYFTSKDTAALAGRYDPNLNGFRATAERTGFGADGRPQYRFGGVGAASTVPTSATGRYVQTNTLGSSGLPPVPYKSYLTEYVDEYREPVSHMDTLRTLTTKFNTTGGTRVTGRSTRSDGLPRYESRVVAF